MIKSPISEGDIDVAKQKVQGLYQDWKQQPEATASRQQLREAVQELKQEAELIADTKSAKQSEEALKAIDATFDPMKVSISEALHEIAPIKPNEVPLPQTVQLIDAPAAEVDQEILEIFLEEASEVVATIYEQLAILSGKQHDKDALTTIRRSYHTLKGSGRMVGLNDLGEVAWNCEQVLNKWLKDDKPASSSLIYFVETSASSFNTWVDSLKSVGTAVINGGDISRLAELLKNDKELDVPVDAAPLVTAASDNEAIKPHTSSLIELSGSPQTSATTMPFASLSEMPDSLRALDLSLGGSEKAELPSDYTSDKKSLVDHKQSLSDELQAVGIDELNDEQTDVVIGPVSVPAQLFGIYLSEAETHLSAMDNEMGAIESNPMRPVSHEFMRAAHTLTSSSRTTGFNMIADVAHALEKWLQDAIETPPEWNDHRLSITRQSVDALATMVLGLFTHEWPLARPDLAQELIDLREQLKKSKRAGEGTNLRVPAVFSSMLSLSLPVAEAPDPAAMTNLFEPAPEPEIIEAIHESNVEHHPEPVEPTESLPVESVESASVVTEPDIFTPNQIVDFNTLVTPVSVHEPKLESSGVSFAAETSLVTVPVIEMSVAPAVPAPIAIETLTPSAAVTQTAIAAAGITPAIVDSWSSREPDVSRDEREAAFESGRDRRAVVDDIDADLMPIFLEEAREIVSQVGDALRRWRAAPQNHTPVTELARHLHTLKGSARMAGLMRLGELAHVLEAKIINMDADASPLARKFDDVDDGLDRFNTAIDNLGKGELAAPIEIPIILDVPGELPVPMAKLAAARAEIVAEGEKLEGRERQALLRVNADMIDRFVNEAGELAIARSRVDLEMQAFKRALLELNDNVSRMKSQLREIEIQAETQIQSRIKEQQEHGENFDPLEFDRFSRMQELTRFLAESLNDVVTLQQSLQKNLDESDAALLQQLRLNRDLQQGLMGVRLVPLGNLQDRFHRLIRQTAKELDKKANLEFRGVRVEIDRSVLEKITAPFEHLLRNAVAHGLELPQQRIAAGKSEIGEITIDAQQVGNEVMLTLTDDGSGLNFARIREKAIQKGMLDINAEVSEA